jgi:L-arabinose isomerase
VVKKLRRRKPRVGLFLSAGKWFWDVGNEAAANSRFGGLSRAVTEAAGNITHKLSETMNVIASEVCLTKDDAVRASTKMREARIDLLIVCSVVWTEDEPVLTILQELPDVPVVLWCYQMKQTLPSDMNMLDLFLLSGPVGGLQLSGAIKKIGCRYGVVFGHQDDPLCLRELDDYAEAARVATDLRRATVGLLPYRCPQMTGTYTDEFRLRSELGPLLAPVSVMELKAMAESVSDRDVNAFVTDIRNRFKVLPEVDENNLHHSARVSLGLAKLILERGFDGLALEDLNPELHEVLGTRPCLSVREIFDHGCVVTMEGDVCANVAMMIQQQFGEGSPMYGEIFCCDMQKNVVVMGHAGMHDVDGLSRGDDAVTVTTDYEYDQVAEVKGTWQIFAGRPGKVTLLSLVDAKDCFQMTVAMGQAIEEPYLVRGSPNLTIRLDVPLGRFFKEACEAGVTQHWALVHGDTRSKLAKLSEITQMRLVVIE